MESKSIFCPRCGSANGATVKYCRQCGLALAPVTGYLTGSGLPSVAMPPPPLHHTNPLRRLLASFTPRQKMILSIILAAMSPAFFAALDVDELSPIAAIMMPFVIILAVFYFRNQEKHLRAGQHLIAPQPIAPPLPPPVPPLSVPGPVGDTARQPAIPVEAVPAQATGSFTPPAGSVTEDETRRLGQRW